MKATSQQSDRLLTKAEQHARAGNWQKASSALGRLLEQRPRHPDALHLLVRCRLALGRKSEALDLLRQTVDALPGDGSFRADLGRLSMELGRLAEAETHLSEALRLGAVTPGLAGQLGAVRMAIGDYPGALDCLTRAHGEEPTSLTVAMNLARTLLMLGRRRQAVEVAELLLEGPAGSAAQTLHFVGGVQLSTDEANAAITTFRRLLVIAPRDWRARLGLAASLANAVRFDDALDAIDKAERANAPADEIALSRAKTLHLKRDTERAGSVLAKRLEVRPMGWQLLIASGELARDRGDFAAAAECYRRALHANPRCIAALSRLVLIKAHRTDEGLGEHIVACLQNTDLEAEGRRQLGFAMGAIHNDLGEYDTAFEWFSRANALSSARLDRAAFTDFVDRSIAGFPDDLRLNSGADSGSGSDLIFIVGLPRSGSTLIEQILATHPQVTTAGERPTAAQLLDTPETILSRRIDDDPAWVLQWDPPRREALARQHRAAVWSGCPHTDWVVDKSLPNFRYLGLIARLHPGAKVIHARREPGAICVSAFGQAFVGAFDYTNDLSDLGFYAREYQRLMRHWRQVLPISMIDLDYEALITDPEPVIRGLAQSLGLPWDDRLLAHYRSDAQVKTASVWQARQPIYRTALERWRHYRHHLGPFFTALEDVAEDE